MSSCVENVNWQIAKQKQLETVRKNILKKEELYFQSPVCCKHCSKNLTYKDFKRKKVFCSRNCSATFNNLKKGELNLVKFNCICGKEVASKSFQKRKFCSIKCQNKLKIENANLNNIELLKKGKLSDKNRIRIKKTMVLMGVEKKCNICNITEWLGNPIPFVLDHKDGNSNNNNLQNLRFLCSNCDSQTPYYKARNKGNGRKSLSIT